MLCALLLYLLCRVFPGTDWVDRLREVLMRIAPRGLDNVITMMCGTCSNENAMKLVILLTLNQLILCSKGSQANWTFRCS